MQKEKPLNFKRNRVFFAEISRITPLRVGCRVCEEGAFSQFIIPPDFYNKLFQKQTSAA
jgi:hypothetical protein